MVGIRCEGVCVPPAHRLYEPCGLYERGGRRLAGSPSPAHVPAPGAKPRQTTCLLSAVAVVSSFHWSRIHSLFPLPGEQRRGALTQSTTGHLNLRVAWAGALKGCPRVSGGPETLQGV